MVLPTLVSHLKATGVAIFLNIIIWLYDRERVECLAGLRGSNTALNATANNTRVRQERNKEREGDATNPSSRENAYSKRSQSNLKASCGLSSRTVTIFVDVNTD